MADPKSQWQVPDRPASVDEIRFFEKTPEATDTMAETQSTRGEPILDVGPTVVTQPAETGEFRGRHLGPTAAPPDLVLGHATPAGGDQLARIEDKTSRIEEKLARSEASNQRVVDRFELSSARMSEVAQQADLAALRTETGLLVRRVNALPGFGALVVVACLAAVLTAVLMIVVLRYAPGLIGR